MERRSLLAGLTAGVASAFAGCTSIAALLGDATHHEHSSHAVEAGTRVRVDNDNGPVFVEGHDGDALEVDVDRRGPSEASLDAVSVVDSVEDGEFRLETIRDEGFAGRRATVSVTIRCPRGVLVERVTTTNGSIELTGVEGDAELESSNASLTARDVDGTVTLRTDNGSITARNVAGVAGVTTTNGNVNVDLETVEDDVSIRTSNGTVDAALATDLDVSIVARAGTGSVDLHDLDLDDVRSTETGIVGRLGDGRYTLELETSNGSIDLHAL